MTLGVRLCLARTICAYIGDERAARKKESISGWPQSLHLDSVVDVRILNDLKSIAGGALRNRRAELALDDSGDLTIMSAQSWIAHNAIECLLQILSVVIAVQRSRRVLCVNDDTQRLVEVEQLLSV